MCADYKGMDAEVALRDFMERVKAYESVYEAVEDTEDGGKISYIKVGYPFSYFILLARGFGGSMMWVSTKASHALPF